MQKVVDGVFVSVHYTGTLDNGAEFDTSKGRNPLEFKVGGGQMIKGFDTAVVGMSLNETKTFTKNLLGVRILPASRDRPEMSLSFQNVASSR